MATRSNRKRIVLKFGSGILTRAREIDLDPKQIAKLTAEIAMLVNAGHQCIAVTSAAVAAGISALRLTERPKDLATAQASAAVGQSKLMRAYEAAFAAYKLNVEQLLLTQRELSSSNRLLTDVSTL